MKKRRTPIFVLLCIACTVAMLLLSACARNTIENTVEKLIDAANKDIEGSSQSGSAGAVVPTGEYDALKWPAWVPDSIPVYRYGDLYHTDRFEDNSATLYLTAIELKKDPFNAYVEKLMSKGWIEDEGWEDPDDENMQVIHMKNPEENMFLIYNVIADDDEVYGSIYYEEDSYVSDDEDSEDEGFTYEIEGEDGVSGVISNEELPDGYPDDFCPLYPGADLIAVQELSDDDMTMYIIMLLSKDDIDTVADFYSKNDNVSMKLGDYVIAFESKDGKMTGQVQLNEAEEEHSELGYRTFIMKSIVIE